MGGCDIRNTILTSRQGDVPGWQSFSSLRLCRPCPVGTIGLAWHKNENENLYNTVFLFLDVSCSGSNSRMRLFPRGSTFYTVIFPLLTCPSLIGCFLETAPSCGLGAPYKCRKVTGNHQSAEAFRQVTSQIYYSSHG